MPRTNTLGSALLALAVAALSLVFGFLPRVRAQGAVAPAALGAPILVPVKRTPRDARWRLFPARTVEGLPGFTAGTEVPRDKYGGRLDRRVWPTGFFRVTQYGGRWYFVDPDGYLCLHVGVDSLAPGDTPPPAFGTTEDWARQTTQMLREAGFDGAGCWSDVAALRLSDPPLPYAVLGTSAAPGGQRGGFMQAFGNALGIAHPGRGHVTYPGDCIPVFHPQFASFCDRYARPLAALKDDPYLVGYFSDNELPMPRLEQYLILPPKDPVMGSSYRAARRWLDARRGRRVGSGGLTVADRNAWTAYVYDRYFAITTKAIRQNDPHHLCLGPRFYGPEKRLPGVFQAAGKWLDVISLNHYGVWDPSNVDLWARWSGRPVLITEWYARAMDTGLGNTYGAGWTVPTQRDRGLFYQTFTLGLLQSKACVGWHWFKYRDDPPTPDAPPPGGQGTDALGSNKGLISADFQPYTPLLDAMTAVNRHIYTLVDYFDSKPPAPAKVP